MIIPGPSLLMRLYTLYLRLKGNSLKPPRFVPWRHTIEHRAYPAPAPMPKDFRSLFLVQEREVSEQPVYTLSPRRRRQPVHIIHTHGGGYVNPLGSAHWDLIRQLIEHTGASVTVPIYPLAPEYTYRETFPVLEEVYRSVLHDYADQKIVLCGDSAGGGLALAQALHYRDLGLRLPNRIVLFSPWLDITISNPEAAAIEPVDVRLTIAGLVQCGAWWAGGDDPRLPLLSPIYGDMSGLPAIDVFQGTADLLIADARKLKEMVSAAGGTVTLFAYQGAFHAFVGATATREAKHTFRQIAMALKGIASGSAK